MPPGPPDSKPPRRGTRAPSLADTLDEADERAQAAAAVIERDVREATAVTAAAQVAAAMSFPRTRTPADTELAAAIAKIRADQPEWNLAENVARALEALAARTDEGERAQAAEAADRAKRRRRWAPVWRWLKTSGAAAALAIGAYAVKALDERGDSRRAAAQQAALIVQHDAAIRSLTATVTADHPIVQIVAARLGMAAPAFPSPPVP